MMIGWPSVRFFKPFKIIRQTPDQLVVYSNYAVFRNGNDDGNRISNYYLKFVGKDII